LAVGVFLPIQLAMAAARTMGTYVHGGALKRGTAGTLVEQGFDVLTVTLFAVASGITWLCGGGVVMFAVSFGVALGVALSLLPPLALKVSFFGSRFFTPQSVERNRFLKHLAEVHRSGLLNVRVTRRLVLLSALRFGTIVLMSLATAQAVSIQIPLWQMTAALPVVILATLFAVTPGGMGVNEFACATGLAAFGVPFSAGAQWALANRLLVSLSYCVVAVCSGIMLYVAKGSAPTPRAELQRVNE
jgi:uncharacterized membrane protein YbhN (UPF0104 family)